MPNGNPIIIFNNCFLRLAAKLSGPTHAFFDRSWIRLPSDASFGHCSYIRETSLTPPPPKKGNKKTEPTDLQYLAWNTGTTFLSQHHEI